MSDKISWMSTKNKRKGIKSIGLARNITERNNKIIVEERYYIISLSNDIELFF